MVRNSKRKAFTIVELVIVIAVIAILAAVMIPTFSGIIENADVSADRQKLDAVNKQIRVYIDTVNQKDITTGEELRAALSGEGTATGVNFFEQFNPQSAKYGYHYWYDEAKQEVVLSKMESLTQAAVPGKMIVRADSPATENAGQIAPHDPRSFTSGFYFLDQSGNEIADLFAAIDNLSAEANLDAYTEKRDAVEALIAKRGDNRQLAENLIERLNSTTILSGNDPIVAASGTKYLHIPANKTNNDYTLQGVGSTVDLHAAFNPNITLPENVKTGDALNAVNAALKDRNQEFHVSVEGNFDTTDTAAFAAKIKDIFGAGSVNGTITVNGNITGNTSDGINIEFTGKIEINVKLDYKNPVSESFTVSADSDYFVGITTDKSEGVNYVANGYIALHKIKATETFTLALTSGELRGETGPTFFQDVEWEVVEGEDVEIGEDGKSVVFGKDFDGTTVVLRATPVAVNDVEGAVIPTSEIELTVVTINNVKFNYASNGTSTQYPVTYDDPFFVEYGDTNTSANFGAFTYSYIVNKTESPITGLDDATKAALAPTIDVIVDANAYFDIDHTDGTFSLVFKVDGIKTITTDVTQKITVKVGTDEYKYDVTIEPWPFALAIPSYKNEIDFSRNDDGEIEYIDHRYTIGDDNPIKLGTLFKPSEIFTGVALNETITVRIYKGATPSGDGTPSSPTSVVEINDITGDWRNYELSLSKDEDITTIEIGTNENLIYAWVKVVDGKNIYTEAEFINADPANNNKPIAGTDTQSIVLHSNLDFTNTVLDPNNLAYGKNNVVRTMKDAHLYGNYYTIEAYDFYDPDRDTANGMSFLSTSGDCSLNQVIIDGPIYHSASLSANNIDLSKVISGLQTNAYGFFCYGVMCSGNMVMNDTYISGFNSPVRLTGVFEANNTVFSGGAWSNVFINNCTSVTFTDSVTIQQKGGYTPTFTNPNDADAKILGMGIYVHGKTQKDALSINLNNLEQYNWVSNDYKGDFGFYIDLALGEVFKSGNAATTLYKHTLNNTDYVNAGIISMGITAKVFGKALADFPLYNIKNIVNDDYNSAQYTTGDPVKSGAIVLGTGYEVTVQVSSNPHASGCDCANGVNYTYGVTDFVGEKISTPSVAE